jgi:hypothetical protein
MNKLELTPVKAYTLRVSVDEMRNATKGMYKNYGAALTDCVGAGWYGSNGEVEIVTNAFEDASGKLYTVNCYGLPTDEKKAHEEKLKAGLKIKLEQANLTADELKYLKDFKFDTL